MSLSLERARHDFSVSHRHTPVFHEEHLRRQHERALRRSAQLAVQTAPSHEPRTPQLHAATANSRRLNVLKASGFSALPLDPHEEERRIRETHDVATEKIHQVAAPLDLQPGDLIISSDALAFAGNSYAGKPHDRADLQRNFENIHRNNSQYDIRSTSVVAEQTESGELVHSHFNFGTRITLDAEQAAFLTTPEGQQAYLEAFDAFYEGKITYEKVASGICVLVLTAMGAVSNLDGVPLHPEQEESSLDAIFGTAFTAIMNVAPQALLFLQQRLDQPNENFWEQLEGIGDLQNLARKAFEQFSQKTSLR